MDNPEKLAAQEQEKLNKNITQYVLNTTICNQRQITEVRHKPANNTLEVKKNRTLFLCGNCNVYHNTQGRT